MKDGKVQMNKLGVMQGRLTDWGYFNPQQFPSQNWGNEFFEARRHGIECIEWMFNTAGFSENPLWSESGRNKVKRLCAETDVSVDSLCANYFMQNSILEKESVVILSQLLNYAEELGISSVIIPLFGSSEPVSAEFKKKFINNIKEARIRSQNNCTDILIETELDACETKELIEEADSPLLKVCYDFGNAVGKAYDVCEELKLLRPYIGNVHIKDKKIGGSSVLLGTGDAKFQDYFSVLTEYKGNYILESYYDNALKDTVTNVTYIKAILYQMGSISV